MDLTVTFTDIRDDTTFDRASQVQRFKRYTFFIGPYGPFVERVPIEQAADNVEITRRVELLKRNVQNLPS